MIIDRYISSEVLRPFVGGLGLLVLIFIGYSATIQLNLAAQGQMDIWSALKLILLNTLITLEVLMPSALFFSVLAAVGRLYRDAEMNALYAAGISRARILEAVFKLAAIVAILTRIISIVGRPWASAHHIAEFIEAPKAEPKTPGLSDLGDLPLKPRMRNASPFSTGWR